METVKILRLQYSNSYGRGHGKRYYEKDCNGGVIV